VKVARFVPKDTNGVIALPTALTTETLMPTKRSAPPAAKRYLRWDDGYGDDGDYAQATPPPERGP
jgi:hypothetical protein